MQPVMNFAIHRQCEVGPDGFAEIRLRLRPSRSRTLPGSSRAGPAPKGGRTTATETGWEPLTGGMAPQGSTATLTRSGIFPSRHLIPATDLMPTRATTPLGGCRKRRSHHGIVPSSRVGSRSVGGLRLMDGHRRSPVGPAGEDRPSGTAVPLAGRRFPYGPRVPVSGARNFEADTAVFPWPSSRREGPHS